LPRDLDRLAQVVQLADADLFRPDAAVVLEPADPLSDYPFR
jgi:hypothetical protein